MRYTPYRGLPAVTAWVKLKFTALNLKKLAIHKWMNLLVSSIFHMIEATLLHGKVASLTGCIENLFSLTNKHMRYGKNKYSFVIKALPWA